MLFGTFRNPRTVNALDAGFEHSGSTRIGAMLAFRDISRPTAPPVLVDRAALAEVG